MGGGKGSLLSDLEAVTDKLSTTEAELDAAKQNRDAVREQYKALSSGMKNAEKYAAEFIRPPEEWLPAPVPLESAKSYRSRLMPMMEHFGKLLLKLYTQCVNLKEKCRQLLHRNENLTRQVDRLQTRLTESEDREAQMNQELSDYHHYANTNPFTSARDRFDYLIEPYLDRFTKDDFVRLIQVINKNNQIYNYSGQRARNNSIIASAKFVLPEDFNYDAYEKFRCTKIEEKPEESNDETEIDASQVPDNDPELPF